MVFGKYGKAGCVTDGRITRYWSAGLNGFLATTSDDQIFIYDIATLRICFITPHFPSKIASFDGCYKYLVVSTANKLFYNERLEIREISVNHQNDIIGCLIISKSILSFSCNKVIIASKTDNGDFIETFSKNIENIASVTKLATIENTALIITLSAFKLYLLNVQKQKLTLLKCSEKIEEGDILYSAQSSHPGVIALLTSKDKVLILDIIADEFLMSLEMANASALSFVLRRDTEFLVLSSKSTGVLSVLNLETRTMEYTYNTNAFEVNNLIYTDKFDLLICIGPNSLTALKPSSEQNFFNLENFRKGHPGPITNIQYYDNDGLELLTCSERNSKCCIGITSTIQQHQSMLFSTKTLLKQSDSTSMDSALRPIKAICVSYIRRFDWPNIITCHESTHQVYIWSGLAKSIFHKRLELYSNRSHATAILLSACGNHAIVGYKNGTIYKFNLQSAMVVGSFVDSGKESAHISTVAELFDFYNNSFASIAKYYEEHMIKVWDIKERKLLYAYTIDIPKSGHILSAVHQFNGYLSAYLVNTNKVVILNISLKSVTRTVDPTIPHVKTMKFHPNSKWLLYCNNHTLVIFDILTSTELHALAFSDNINTFLPSPDGTFIYISHVNSIGTVHIYTPKKSNDIENEAEDLTVDAPNLEQFPGLISSSGCKLGFLEALLMHDEISRKAIPNKIEKSEEVPFFLPTEYKEGSLVFSKPDKKIIKKKNLSKVGINETFLSLISVSGIDKIFEYLKSQTPAAIHLIFSCDMEAGDVEKILQFFIDVAKSKENYDLCQVYLSIFIKYNSQALLDTRHQSKIDELRCILSKDWNSMRDDFESISCYLKFFAHI